MAEKIKQLKCAICGNDMVSVIGSKNDWGEVYACADEKCGYRQNIPSKLLLTWLDAARKGKR